MIQQTFLVRHLTAQNSYQRSLHFHDINEILFSLNDGCSFFLDGQTYPIERGALVLIPEGTILRKINLAHTVVDTYTLLYPPAMLEAYSTPCTNLNQIYRDTARCIQVPEGEIDRTIALFEQCLTMTDGAFGNDLRRNMLFLDLLLRFYPLLSNQSGPAAIHSNVSPQMADILAYISCHLTERITLERLSNTFFISKYNLCRQFKKETGFTVVEYINSSRIRMACTILRKEQDTSNIGARVGFSNASHFIHTFRQYTGVTPNGYKKRYKNFTNVPVFSNFSPHEPEST